jgi:anti-anti-sigma factor
MPEDLMTSHLEIADEPLDRSIRLIVLRGELDRTTTPQLAVRLSQALLRRRPAVIVDLTELTSMDAAAVALLHDSQSQIAAARGYLAVVGDRARHWHLSARPRAGITLDVSATRAQAIATARRSAAVAGPCAVRPLLDVPAG